MVTAWNIRQSQLKPLAEPSCHIYIKSGLQSTALHGPVTLIISKLEAIPNFKHSQPNVQTKTILRIALEQILLRCRLFYRTQCRGGTPVSTVFVGTPKQFEEKLLY